MDLVLDIGNSRSKLAWVKGSQLTPLAPVENVDLLDELARLPVSQTSARLALASVANPALQAQVAELMTRLGWQVILLRTGKAAFGLRNSYADVSRMGVDRWLAMIGAWRKVQAPLVVLDVGTAMTLDVVDGTGQHLGGWILPGYRLMLDSIGRHTARVGLGELQAPAFAFGQETGVCLQQGCRAGLFGAATVGLQLATEQLGQRPELFLTGGGLVELPDDALAGLDSAGTHRRPLLVLEGMAAFLPAK